MIRLRPAVLALLLCGSGLLQASTPFEFRDAAEETRFRALTAELRCVMCQNQSLADSNAGIAEDLRREVFALMREGRSNDEIKRFLTERYGEFVLYRPPLREGTWLLWFGPLLVLLGGGAWVAHLLRQRAALAPARPPADDPLADDTDQDTPHR